jgi:oxygen-independent coproporphyrinogen-3 oxidase
MSESSSSFASTLQLLERYDRPGPRYTSYPTAVEFNDSIGNDIYVERLARMNNAADEPLSAYVHLPFCEHRCSFCGCNVVITPHREVASRYLEAVEQEIDLLASHLPNRRTIAQLHWGGGTPTYYTPEQLARVFARIARHFTFTADAELGVEIDPRVTTIAHLDVLRSLGFNRLSMGVQDFDPKVQQAINRIQSYEMTRDLLVHAREHGFSSINIDLIYGLPHQTPESFGATLDQVLTLRPDRVAAYSFAFVPWMSAHMKRIDIEALPPSETKLALLAATVDAFLGAGYQQIGMDHFALPTDELARAIDTRTLNRNFMGYTVKTTTDMVAMGISAIGNVQGAFVQNTKKLPEYYEAVAAGRFPIERGYALDQDDEIRRYVITELMCNFRLDIASVEQRFGIVFADYFAGEMAALTAPEQSPVADGLVAVTAQNDIEVLPTGRMFVRNVCMIFDKYLARRTGGPKPVFSRTV